MNAFLLMSRHAYQKPEGSPMNGDTDCSLWDLLLSSQQTLLCNVNHLVHVTDTPRKQYTQKNTYTGNRFKEHLATCENAHDIFSGKWKLQRGYTVGPQLWREHAQGGHGIHSSEWELECLWSWVLDGCHLLPFYFFCFPSFQHWARSTSIGKINLNKSIKVTGMVEVRLQQKLHSRPAQATQGSRTGSSGTQSYTEKKGWLVGTGNKYQQALAGDLGLNYCSSCCFL